jgi:hypothetical protein
MASLSPPPKLQFFDAAGVPLVGGKLYSYSAGTTTPLATFTSEAGTTPNTNPIILNSRGEAEVWLGTSSYKFKLTTATDVEVWTVDNIVSQSGLESAIKNYYAASAGATRVGYVFPDAGAVARTVASKMNEFIHLYDFGAVGDGVADDTTAINAWLTAVLTTGKPGYWGQGHFRYTGTQLEIVIGGLAATQGGMLIGAGGARTIVDVTACTGTPQFLVRCQANFLFYWTFAGFEIRGNRDGVMAQFGQDWTGSAYPDALNSCRIEDIVCRNNSTGTNAVGVRFNLVLETSFHVIANNGSNANLNGTAIELRGVQFSIGKFAGGNAQYGLGIYLFTFGNRFNCDLEVLRSVVYVDSASGWNCLEGQMVWGAPSPNPALSGLDGTTTAVVAPQAGAPLVFDHNSNWSSNPVPVITGGGKDRIWLLGRGQGIQTAEGFRFTPLDNTRDADLYLIPATGRGGNVRFIRSAGFATPENLRWSFGIDSADDLLISRYNSSGVFQDTPWYIEDTTGKNIVKSVEITDTLALASYTVAALPSASPAGQLVFASNAASGSIPVFSDGTNWRRVDDRNIVS